MLPELEPQRPDFSLQKVEDITEDPALEMLEPVIPHRRGHQYLNATHDGLAHLVSLLQHLALRSV